MGLVIPELLAEVLQAIATHYGASVADLKSAYALDIGTLRVEVRKLYATTYGALQAAAIA